MVVVMCLSDPPRSHRGDRHGRRREESALDEVVADFEASGLSQRAFAEQKQIGLSNLRYCTCKTDCTILRHRQGGEDHLPVPPRFGDSLPIARGPYRYRGREVAVIDAKDGSLLVIPITWTDLRPTINRGLSSTPVEPVPPSQATTAEDAFASVVGPEQRDAILQWIAELALREVRGRHAERDPDERD